MRVTIIPEDQTITMNGQALHYDAIAVPTDPNIHAIQFYDDGHATIEKKIGDREWLEGAAAVALVTPFVETWQAEDKKQQAAEASARAKPLLPPYEPQPAGGVQEL